MVLLERARIPALKVKIFLLETRFSRWEKTWISPKFWATWPNFFRENRKVRRAPRLVNPVVGKGGKSRPYPRLGNRNWKQNNEYKAVHKRRPHKILKNQTLFPIVRKISVLAQPPYPCPRRHSMNFKISDKKCGRPHLKNTPPLLSVKRPHRKTPSPQAAGVFYGQPLYITVLRSIL